MNTDSKPSLDNAVRRLGSGLYDRGSIPDRVNEKIFFSSLPRPVPGSPNLLPKGTKWVTGTLTPGGEAARTWSWPPTFT